MLCSKCSCFQHTSPSSSRSRASPPSRTWGAGPDAGPGGPGQSWARDAAPLARLTAHPGDYIWALSGPGGPRPRPACFPRHTGRHGAGPPEGSGPSMAMCPPGRQGPGPTGRERGKIPSEPWRSQPLLPMGQRPTPQRKVCLHPPHRRRGGLSLKGHEPPPPPRPAGSGPLLGRGHLQTAPRLGLLTCSLPAVASLHTSLGRAQRGQVTHPRSHSLGLSERPERSCSYVPPCLDSGPDSGSWGQPRRAQGHIRSPLGSSCSDTLPNQAGRSAPHHPCPHGGSEDASPESGRQGAQLARCLPCQRSAETLAHKTLARGRGGRLLPKPAL